MRSSIRFAIAAALVVAILSGHSPAFAQKPKPGGGGGTTAAYTVVDLPGPYHVDDGNWSETYAERISDPNSISGTIFITGWWYDEASDQRVPCLWSVDRNRNVSAYDLGGSFQTYLSDVNSDGVVIGTVPGGRGAVLAPGFGLTILPTPVGPNGPVPSDPRGITNRQSASEPGGTDAYLIVGSVGRVDEDSPSSTLWTVSLDGVADSSVPLRDSSGWDFWPHDVNDAAVMAGLAPDDDPLAPALPAVAYFAEPTDPELEPELIIEPLNHPDSQNLPHIYDLQLSHAGDVVGQSGMNAAGGGTIPHALVWPFNASGFDLSVATGITSTQGNGIASVGGIMQVAGRAETSAGAYAFVYTQGRLSNLNPISKGSQAWKLWHGEGVNSSGCICGYGEVGSRKATQRHGFLLIPNAQ